MKLIKVSAALVALAGASGVLFSYISPVLASVNGTPYPTNITLNGRTVSSPSHIVANDAGTSTSWIPIYYLQTALRQIGIQNTWNGYTWNLQLPAGQTPDLSNLPKYQARNNSSMAISINGRVVQYAPRIVTKDLSGTAQTSYAPIWYLQQVMARMHIQYSWNGTDWKMTSSTSTSTTPSGNGSNGGGTTSNQSTKLDAAKTFAAVLGIAPDASGSNPYDDVSSSDWGVVNALTKNGYFTADSSTHFGSTDGITAQTIDHAYQLYLGIPDSHMAWNAGGNTLAWGSAIKLNSGVPTSGDLTTANVQQMSSNLTNLNRGYSKNSDGSFQLWFKPYDAYVPFYQNFAQSNQTPPWGNASLVSQTLAHDIEMTDNASVKESGAYAIWKVPGVALNSTDMVSVMSNNGYTGFNFNGGSSWTTATGYMGYDSTDSSNGGRSSASSFVWVKAQGQSQYSVSYNDHKDYPTYTSVVVSLNSNGAPTIAYSRSGY